MEGHSRLEAEKKLIEKAFEDEAFKNELIADPKQVLQKEFGAELPADTDIKVLEITPQKTYFVIPMKPPADVDLPDESEARPGGEAIVLKAWKDEAFKKELLSDPKAALKKGFNADLPGDLAIEALEETPNNLYITIPLKRPADDELSDEQLEAVAGGECITTTACCIGLGVLAVGLFTTITASMAIDQGVRRGW